MQIDKVVLAATGIVIEDKKILLLRRSKNEKNYVGFWQPPEGHIENGENPENTIIREVKEELGIVVKNVKFLGTSSHLYKLKEGNMLGVRIIFRVNAMGNITISDEHTAFKWFSKKDLVEADKIVPGTASMLLTYL